MTKEVKQSKKELGKKKSRRDKAKYPGFDKKYNIKSRQDYIEADYVDGVCDTSGKQVIRPLTDEEKDWLSRFYDESVGANFKHKGDSIYDDKEDRRKIYGENNARNRCLYNKSKAAGFLTDFDVETYDVFSNNQAADGYFAEELLIAQENYLEQLEREAQEAEEAESNDDNLEDLD